MTQASIEIRARDVDVYDGAQHMYIVYTTAAGEEYVLSGFPEYNGTINSSASVFIGNLYIVNELYTENSFDYEGTPQYPSTTLFTGTDAEVLEKVSVMLAKAEQINTEGYDYNLPLIETFIPSWADLNDQNSNTVAYQLAKAAGLESGVESFITTNNLNVPGYQATLEHSSFEKTTETLFTAIQDAGQEVTEFVGNISDFFSKDIPDLFQDSNDFFSDLLTLQGNASGSTIESYNGTTYTVQSGDTVWDIAEDYGLTVEELLSLDGNEYLEGRTSGDFILIKPGDTLTIPGAIENGSINDIMQDVFATFASSQETQRSDPLVLDLNGDGVKLTNLDDSNVYFDIDNDGISEHTAWISKNDAFLVQDNNGNGKIDDISELFGDNSTSGFSELAALDSNSDSLIDAADDAFSSLRLWQDTNENGYSESTELHSLTSMGVSSISLSYEETQYFIENSLINASGGFNFADGTSNEMLEVHFELEQFNSLFGGTDATSSGALDIDVYFLPLSRGYGDLSPLHVAMGEDAALKAQVEALSALEAEDISSFSGMLEEMLYQWAGITSVDADSRGEFVDAQHLAFLEAFSGSAYSLNGSPNPNAIAGAQIENAWTSLMTEITARILVQGTFSDLFPDASYDFQTDTLTLGTSSATILSLLDNYSLGDSANRETSVDFWLTVSSILTAHVSDFSDTTSSALQSDLTTLFSEKLWIDISEVDNLITGSTGNDSISGERDNDYIMGGAGADSLYGTRGNDILEGGTGDDTINASGGNNTVIYNSGDGNDTITFNQNYSKYTQLLQFGEGISADDLTLTRQDFNLVLTFNNQPDDSITLKSFFYDNTNRPTEITFTDGTVWYDTDDRFNLPLSGTDGDDSLSAGLDGSTLYSLDGNDTLRGSSGDDILSGGDGDDILYGNTRSDISGYDTFEGGQGDDVMYGHNKGGTYIYNAGDGSDVIHELSTGTDILLFGEGINPEDVTLTRTSYDLVISFANSSDTITFSGYYTNTAYALEEIHFSDEAGTVWDVANDFNLALVGTDGDDDLYGSSDADVIMGGDGDDTLYGYAGNNILIGGKGDDALIGGGHTGSGNPYTGGNGDNTYIFNMGDGNDKIEDRNDYRYESVNDKIVLGEGFTTENVKLYSDYSQNLIIDFTNSSGDSILVSGQFKTEATSSLSNPVNYYQVEYLEFADGTVWDLTDTSLLTAIGQTITGSADTDDMLTGTEAKDSINGNSGNDTLTGNGGDDKITGGEGDDILTGSTGDDYIEGDKGSDTYYYNAGDGNDTTSESDPSNIYSDTIILGENITANSLYFTKGTTTSTQYDLTFNFYSNADDSLTIKNFFYNQSLQVETLQFNDGTTWDLSEISIQSGDSGSNNLTAASSFSILYGNDGDDMLTGAADGSIQHYSGGDGTDTFVIKQAANSTDIIHDFDLAASEKLDLSDFNEVITSFGTLYSHMTQSGDNTVIDLGNGQSLTLRNTSKNLLGASYFSGTASLNNAPVAGLTTSTTSENQAILIDVLSSASDADGDTPFLLSLGAHLTPENGNIQLENGHILYTPDAGFYGTDSFSYTLTDGYGTSTTETLTITVEHTNHTPTSDIAISTQYAEIKSAFEFTVPDTAFSDTDGDTLTYSATLSDGSALPSWLSFDAESRTFSGTPAASAVATTLAIILTASDGSAAASQQFDLNIVNHLLEGSDSADTLKGSTEDDSIFGGSGDDFLYGRNGADHLKGENGNDTLKGNAGDDALFGGTGNDRLEGGKDNDLLYGKKGNDKLFGNSGNDSLYGGKGNDILKGGAGHDILEGGAAKDSLFGGKGNDYFVFSALSDSTKKQADVIHDFSQAEGDKISFTELSGIIHDFSDLTITNDTADTFLSVLDESFKIKLVGVINLNESDFLFG